MWSYILLLTILLAFILTQLAITGAMPGHNSSDTTISSRSQTATKSTNRTSSPLWHAPPKREGNPFKNAGVTAGALAGALIGTICILLLVGYIAIHFGR